MGLKKRKGFRAGGGVRIRLDPGEGFLMLTFAGISLFIALVVRLLSGNPRSSIVLGNLTGVVPPLFLMTLLWMIWHILLGAAFGSVMGRRVCRDEAGKYKGGMLFILMMALIYIWYPLFFGALALFSALLVCEAVLALSFIIAVLFIRVRRWAGFVMLAFAVWMLYMTSINIVALFAL